MIESENIKVMKRHGMAMGSMDPDVIAADYAEDAVVICNLLEEPAVGRPAIRDMIAQILDMGFLKTPEAQELSGETGEIAKDIEAGEYVLHMFENKAAGMNGVETYRVKDDKIVFESACITIL